MNSQPQKISAAEWRACVSKVDGADPQIAEHLYRVFSRGLRFLLSRRCGPKQLEAQLQETFAILVSTIKPEDLCDPAGVARIVRTIALKQAAAYSGSDVPMLVPPDVESPTIRLDHRNHPDHKSLLLQDQDRMISALRSVSHQEQEALTRFYLHGHTQERICQEMSLSEKEFVALKADVRARFDAFIMSDA